MTHEPALLAIENVSLAFGGLQALAGASLQVARGEILALIGPNGAGKTTLLNIVCGALRPTSGQIYLKGESIAGKPAHEVNARGIARTFQAAEPFHTLTVRENVMAGGVAHSGIGVLHCLKGWGLSNRISRELAAMADEQLAAVGLSAHAEEPASILPAGKQRLLGIARALATNAELLVLDEPGAGLSETEKAELARMILRLRDRGKTILFVEHDMTLVGRISDRIV
ncbi:MAG: ABC transporter ATP-binding protein, partial [Roseiarcus sp.]